MNLLEFRRLLSEKNSNRDIELDDEKLGERIFAGLKKIGMDTLPLILVENSDSNATMMRRIDSNTWVRVPVKPIISTDEIDTDIMLLDALAYYVMAGLERSRAKIHMGMYYGEIEMNNVRLIETWTEEDEADIDRYKQFP